MLNYTYSKSLGDGYLGADNTSGYADYGVNEFYGVASNNRPNVFSTVYVVHAPNLHGGNSILRGAVERMGDFRRNANRKRRQPDLGT